VIQSDYDLVAVTPSFFHTLPYLAKNTIGPSQPQRVSLDESRSDPEMEAFLEHGWLSTGGKIIGGKTDLEPILMKLTPPDPRTSWRWPFLAGQDARLHPSRVLDE